MRVYTRAGDDGTSGLIGGTRVNKYDLRLETYGTVDELNSWLGVIRSQQISETTKDKLIKIQKNLFLIGSRLATDTNKVAPPKDFFLFTEDVTFLEKEIDSMLDLLPPMTHFVLPGGNLTNSYCHVARTVCRRAERRACQLLKEVEFPIIIVEYLNRLSDYLFVLSRKVAYDEGVDEVLWLP